MFTGGGVILLGGFLIQFIGCHCSNPLTISYPQARIDCRVRHGITRGTKMQLMRWGQYYASWGTLEEVILRAVEFEHRPWWWLKICGWNVGLECFVGPIIQWTIQAPKNESERGEPR